MQITDNRVSRKMSYHVLKVVQSVSKDEFVRNLIS